MDSYDAGDLNVLYRTVRSYSKDSGYAASVDYVEHLQDEYALEDFYDGEQYSLAPQALIGLTYHPEFFPTSTDVASVVTQSQASQ